MTNSMSNPIDSVGAFNLGKNAARNGQPVEKNPFDKGDPRSHQWIEGFRAWRCKDTLDLFEMAD